MQRPRLAEAFNTTPQLWLTMQQNYDLRQAEKKEKNFTVRRFHPSPDATVSSA